MHVRPSFLAAFLLAAAGLGQAQQAAPMPPATAPEWQATLEAQKRIAAANGVEINELMQLIQTINVLNEKQKKALSMAMNLRNSVPGNALPEAATPAGPQKSALELACRDVGITSPVATVGQLNNTIQQLRERIDTNGSSVQMLALRMRNLTNKNTQGDPLVTNEAKKLSDRRPGDPGTMR